MPMTPLALMLQEIYSEIPLELLNVTFDPKKYQTTLDDRIISEVLNARVMGDVNIRMGQSAQIELQEAWRIDTSLDEYQGTVGNNFTAAYYLVPPEAREYKNIATVERVINYTAYQSPTNSGPAGTMGALGNTVAGLAAASLESYTHNAYSCRVDANLESPASNIIRVYPDTMSEGLRLDCKLEYDLEMTNANQNIVIAMQNLALCAVKNYIYINLVIKLDSTAIVNGASLGTLRDIASDEYKTAGQDYKVALKKLRAASLMEPKTLRKLSFMMVG